MVGLAVAALSARAAPVGAVPILEPADAQELAAQLAEATEAQGICYGWSVTVYDEGRGSSEVDVGSSRGVGQSAEQSCPRFIVFRADVVYTPESSESEDSASFYLFGNVANGPTEDDLRRVGFSAKALVGNDDDLALINAVQALPVLVAERRIAGAVPADPTEGTIPAQDRPTNRPGSDWTRTYGHFVLLSVVLVLGGLGWAAYAWLAERHGPFTDE